MLVSRMKLLILCVSALCCAAVCVSGQQDVSGDTTSTGRYTLYIGGYNWPLAYKNCRDQSSHLAVIESQEEADNIETLMRIYDVNTIHVGATDKYETGRFVTILDQDVEATGYNKWRAGFPNLLRGNCVGFSRFAGEVGLMNINCSNGNPSFCEERRWDTYQLIPGHGYYNYYGQLRTWPEARQICRQQGAHLVVFNSNAENLAVYQKFRYSWAFVGITDKRHTGVQASMFNTPVDKTGYSTWQGGSPYNSTNNPFVSTFQNWFMVSEFHTNQLGYVCEHALITA